MPKLKLGSWLSPGSPLSSSSTPSRPPAQRKKLTRRSFSAFASVSPAKSKAKGAEERIKSTASLPEEDTVETAAGPVGEAPSTSTMVALARKITQETEKLESYLRENNLPMPGFEVDAPGEFPKLPEDVARSRQEIIFATKELRDLVVGPREGLRWGVWGVSYLAIPDFLFNDKLAG